MECERGLLQGEVEFEVVLCVSVLWTNEGESSFKGWTLALGMTKSSIYNM